MNNPLAFPVPPTFNSEGQTCDSGEDGMTLLDYFAGQALTGIASRGVVKEWDLSADLIARHVYIIASAMLIEREKRMK